MDHTLATPDRQRMSSQGQILRLLQRVALQEGEAAIADACNVAIVWVARGVQANVDDYGVLCQSVEVGDALEENVAGCRNGGDLAAADWLVYRKQRVDIVPYTLDLGDASADNARGLI